MKAPTKPDTDLIYVYLFLKAQSHLDLINQKWVQLVRKTHRPTPYQDALAGAKWALTDRLEQQAVNAKNDGKLLFCFEGTTVLQGGAA